MAWAGPPSFAEELERIAAEWYSFVGGNPKPELAAVAEAVTSPTSENSAA
jgi:hypothetical protein